MNRNTVLIIDDDAVNIEILVEMLNSKYELKVAYDGLLGIKIAKKVLPDLILLDIEMPNMDGFDVACELKNNDNTKDIPIIFLTSKTDKEVIIAALSSGAVDYIIKPYFKDELEARIAKHLKTRLLKKIKVNKNISLENIDIKKIREFLGIKEEIIFKMLISFSNTYHDIENDIKNLDKNSIEFISYIRKLRSASGSLQIDVVYDLCSFIEKNSKANNIKDKIIELILKMEKITKSIKTNITPLIIKNKIIEENEELLKSINSIIYDSENYNFINDERISNIYNSLENRIEISLLDKMVDNFKNNDYESLDNILEKIKRAMEN